MRTVQLPDEIVAGLEAVAALDQCTVTELAAGALVDLLADRYHAIQNAYVALRELDPDNGRPTTAAAPVSTNGHRPAATPARKATKSKRCQRGGCDKKVKARGMCNNHYTRWYSGKEPVAPDGTVSPAAHENTQEGAPDTRAPRTHDVDEGGRQDSQPPEAGDGPPSSTSPPEPQGQVDPDDPSCCQAARCRSAKEAIDDDFCPTHTSILKRMTAKLRAEFGEEARDEATDRIIAGTR